jgi:hypothetical protein
MFTHRRKPTEPFAEPVLPVLPVPRRSRGERAERVERPALSVVEWVEGIRQWQVVPSPPNLSQPSFCLPLI